MGKLYFMLVAVCWAGFGAFWLLDQAPSDNAATERKAAHSHAAPAKAVSSASSPQESELQRDTSSQPVSKRPKRLVRTVPAESAPDSDPHSSETLSHEWHAEERDMDWGGTAETALLSMIEREGMLQDVQRIECRDETCRVVWTTDPLPLSQKVATESKAPYSVIGFSIDVTHNATYFRIARNDDEV